MINKKKVYIVTQGNNELYHIVAVFLKKKKAKEFQKYCRDSRIEIHTLYDNQNFEPMTMVEIECAFYTNDGNLIPKEELKPIVKIYNTNNHIYDSNTFNNFYQNKFVFKRRIELDMLYSEYIDSDFYKEHIDYMNRMYDKCKKNNYFKKKRKEH